MPVEQAGSVIMEELVEAVDGEVHFDQLTRHLYSTDASDYRKMPLGVVLPRTVGDVSRAISIAARHGISVIPRGGGSSLSGQTVGPGLVLDHSKYLNRILDFNIEEKWVWAESGVVLDMLNARVASQGLMVGPDPSSSAVATVGGMIGNNSTGSHSIQHGMMADHLLAVEAVLGDGSIVVFDAKQRAEALLLAKKNTTEGRIYRDVLALLEKYGDAIRRDYPGTWRNVAGYGLNRLLPALTNDGPLNLAHLIAGSEGTLAYVTKAKLRLVPKPSQVWLTIIQYSDLEAALQAVPAILTHKVSAVELMSHATLKLAHEHPVYSSQLHQFVEGIPGAILIVEFSGSQAAQLEIQAEALAAEVAQTDAGRRIHHCTTVASVAQVLNVRKAVLGLILSRPGATRRINIIDDPTVPVAQLVSFTREVTAAGRKHGIAINFDAHASAGCLHMCPEMDLKTEAGITTLQSLAKEVVEIAIKHQGTSTGEHGEGIARSHFNRLVYGQRLHEAFIELKAIFDPYNRLNPGKKVNAPLPWDHSWLKFYPGYQTPLDPRRTFLDFSAYGGMAGLVHMCNGQGSCRSQWGGAMCPSYRITRDEIDTPRGRANALRGVLTGELGSDGMGSEELLRVLDLCLECKICRSECSTRVDIAKLKYEFLAQYQARRGIPLRSRVFAALDGASAIGSLAPRLFNALYQSTVFRKLLDRTIKIDRRRALPLLASQTFQHWFHHRPARLRAGRRTVVLWDDCHLRYHEPHIGIAAVRLLEAAGCDVRLVGGRRCCGRPLISKGLLDQARINARHNVHLLAEFIESGAPVIGVEPSCIACFRDEYPDLVKTSAARRLAEQTFFFEEFITGPGGRALKSRLRTDSGHNTIKLHTHCYQKSFGTAAQVVQMLQMISGTRVEIIESSCCGMAGAFGYEKEHYEMSMAIGESVLFPAVRSAAPQVVIAAPGVSCRQHIRHGTGRKAVHPIVLLADVLIPKHSY
jgi:FAD/FMN-containing dehydrogenase/Fe-S oxidoreductase